MELDCLNWERDMGQTTFIIPKAVLNYGLIHNLGNLGDRLTYEVLLNGQPAKKCNADPADPIEKFRSRKKSEDADFGVTGLQVHTGTVAFANIRIRKQGRHREGLRPAPRPLLLARSERSFFD